MPLNTDTGGVGRRQIKITSSYTFFKATGRNREADDGTITKMEQREGAYLFQCLFFFFKLLLEEKG